MDCVSAFGGFLDVFAPDLEALGLDPDAAVVTKVEFQVGPESVACACCADGTHRCCHLPCQPCG